MSRKRYALCMVLSLAFLAGCSSDGGNGGNAGAPPTSDALFVVTSDFTTGSYSVVDLRTQDTFPDITPDGVHSDAIARQFGGIVYVVNRLGVDSIQVIDPRRGYITPAGAELSVGNGTNPQDIAFVSPTKAYVSRLQNTAELLIINPSTLTMTGTIDLSALLQPGDTDGSPEFAYMLVHQGLLYVALQHLESFAPVAPGQIVVIDPATDTVLEAITLNTTNPITELQFSPALNRILIGSAGEFGVMDGGIEAIDPVTREVSLLIDEAALGGDLTHFVVVSATQGFAVVLNAAFQSSLVSFQPTTGTFRARLAGPFDAFVPHFAVTQGGELFLAVNDRTAAVPEIFVFDVAQERATTRIPSGILPPVYILPLE